MNGYKSQNQGVSVSSGCDKSIVLKNSWHLGLLKTLPLLGTNTRAAQDQASPHSSMEVVGAHASLLRLETSCELIATRGERTSFL